MNTPDTIVAIATPPGRGGIGVIRASGPAVTSLVQTLLRTPLKPRYAHYLPFYDHDGTILDSGLALFFPAPASYTGEDVLELHAHGSPIVLDLVLRQLINSGARLAKPGEFSERAFLNGKIDLTQAEAIADLIASSTEQSARSAQRSLQGEFSRQIDGLLEELVQLRQFVEASIDFVDEEIDFLSQGQIATRLASVAARLTVLDRTAQQGSVLRNGLNVVIAGLPNAGKSSLLNHLAGRDTAIVSEVPGTTRDSLSEFIHLDGLPVHIIDTAGLRETSDPVEQEGVRRTRAAISKADRVLLVIDDCDPRAGEAPMAELPDDIPISRIYNKIDLTGRAPHLDEQGTEASIALSLSSGAGLDLLREHLKRCAGYDSDAQNLFMARRRHLEALNQAQCALLNARELMETDRSALELIAEDLRQAQLSLSEITGKFTTDDLLDKIFSDFCIGK